MANSGTMQGNSVTVTGGGNAGNYFFINWQLAGQDVTNNTSTINWQAYFHFNGDDSQLNNGVAALSGTRWSNGGRVYSYSGNFSTRDLQLSAGSFTIGHNSDGTQSISVSGGVDVYQSGRSQGSAGWSLPTIPRNSQVTTSASSYPLGSPVIINTNRKSGSFTHTITLRMDNAAGTLLQTQNNVTDSWTWTPTSTQITDMQNHIPNSNTFTLYIDQYNNQVKASSSATVALNLTDANPTFTDFTFKDNNSAVATITGNNQVLVKGQSSLLVTVPAASKLIANKGATADHYAITYDGTTNQTAYATTDVTSSFTPIVSVGDRTILVGAYDSRGNSTTVSKLITVYDYVAPTISTSLTRLNNFDANTTVHIEGTYTPLVIGGVNKNVLTSGTLQYRYQPDGGTFGSWVTKTFTANTTAGTFSVTDFVVSLDNTKKYNFEFHINDKFGQVTTTNSVDVGTPVLFVGTDGFVAANGSELVTAGSTTTLTNKTIDASANTITNLHASGIDWTNWPAFMAMRTTNQSLVGPGTSTLLCNDVKYDVTTSYSTTTGKFIAPMSGAYHLGARAITLDNVGGQYSSIGIYRYINNTGTPVRYEGTRFLGGASVQSWQVDIDLWLNAGDSVVAGIVLEIAPRTLNGSQENYFYGRLVVPGV